ncbi:MAG: U32 family peptidase [Prevotellaceae bacterium]|nr:U32 family peptidase [Prevotellaceae bacterium]
MKKIELLSPAKNIECGKAAIDNGADAVYIGAPKHGARTAAGNSMEDIRELTEYAHQFGAKVYVTVNTILYDDEIDEAIDMMTELKNANVDAILVQDMALVELSKEIDCPPLHASTQMDIRTPEKVAWLKSLGFTRVVLARELSLAEISAIHKAVPDIELEVFVHGALCVSYSGQCYASQYCFNRSANRGECAQFCRMQYNLTDGDGRLLEKDKYLLSLKDMNRIENLEELIKAGAVSFKIEGRLKDADYVKNVTAAYSQKLNSIIEHCEGLERASYGRCTYEFTPNLNKTFNRGYTNYFLYGRADKVADFNTPKSKGEYVGDVKEIRRNSFNVAGIASFANGDGLCFINENGILEGFRANKVEGNRIYPHKMPMGIYEGARLYRNNDAEFQRILASAITKRKVLVDMVFAETEKGFSLTMIDESGHTATETIECKKERARLPQYPNIRMQLLKLGNTIYECRDFKVEMKDDWFIPSSLLSDLRRRTCDALNGCTVTEKAPNQALRQANQQNGLQEKTDSTYLTPELSYLSNVSNEIARNFYLNQGVKSVEPAFESVEPNGEKLIMQCKHCIRWSLGMCHKQGSHACPTLFLESADRRRFRLEFDCKNCQMNIYAEE